MNPRNNSEQKLRMSCPLILWGEKYGIPIEFPDFWEHYLSGKVHLRTGFILSVSEDPVTPKNTGDRLFF